MFSGGEVSCYWHFSYKVTGRRCRIVKGCGNWLQGQNTGGKGANGIGVTRYGVIAAAAAVVQLMVRQVIDLIPEFQSAANSDFGICNVGHYPINKHRPLIGIVG